MVWLFFKSKKMNNITNRIKHEVIDFSMASKSVANLSLRHPFLPGTILAAAIHLNGALPTQLVNCGIKGNGGNTLIEYTTIRDWQQRQGGAYIESMKPLFIEGGRQLIIELNSPSVLAAALSGQIVFLTQEDSDQC